MKSLETDKKIVELMKRYEDIDMEDAQTWSNQAVFFTRQLWNMLVLARVITIGAYNRNESRSTVQPNSQSVMIKVVKNDNGLIPRRI